ncbi:MAG: cytochrome b/b6 domain-containing protein [Caldilineaceae bacterium]
MKRFLPALFILVGWLIFGGVASAQTLAANGWPPQTQLFTDAHFLAQAIPFVIALAIVLGILQARAAIRGGGDAILGEKVRRHDVSTVTAHWSNAIGMILCMLTGAVVLRWVDYKPELRLLYLFHYVGAALIIYGVFNHLARHTVSGGTGLIPKSFGVIRDVIGELLEYAGLFGPEGAVFGIPWPKAIRQPIARYTRAILDYRESRTHKYLATEQLLSYPVWGILIAIVVVTGLIKVMRYVYVVPGSLLATATVIHDLTTIAVVIMLVIHLLPLLLVPANWPLLLSMFKTTVSRRYVENRHPAWYKALLAKPRQVETAPSESSEQQPAQVKA